MSDADVQLPVLAMETFEELKEIMGEDFDALYDEYFEQMPSLLESLAEAVSGNDHTNIISLTHRIKSGSGNLGLEALAAVSGYMEERLRVGEMIDLTDALADINQAYQKAQELVSCQR